MSNRGTKVLASTILACRCFAHVLPEQLTGCAVEVGVLQHTNVQRRLASGTTFLSSKRRRVPPLLTIWPYPPVRLVQPTRGRMPTPLAKRRAQPTSQILLLRSVAQQTLRVEHCGRHHPHGCFSSNNCYYATHAPKMCYTL